MIATSSVSQLSPKQQALKLWRTSSAVGVFNSLNQEKSAFSPSVPLHMRPCEQCRIMVRRTIALLDISNLPFSMFIITKPSPSHPGGLCSQRLVGRLSTVSVVILHTCAFSNHTGLSSSSQLGPSSFLLLSRRLPCKMILLRKSRIMFCGSIAWPCSLSWLALGCGMSGASVQ